MAESPVVQLRVPEATLALIDEARGERSRSAWFLGLADQELLDGGPEIANPLGDLAVTNEIQPGGIPSPGVACSWPECWARDTRRFGVTDPSELARGDYRDRPRDAEKGGLALCPSHAALLAGFRYVRPRAADRAASRAAESA